jgi:copper(I)-binding protein
MSRALSRRTLLQAGLLAGVGGWAMPGRACEFFTPQLRITHPWAYATPDTAEFAPIFMRIDEVRASDRLIAAHTPLARSVELAGISTPKGNGLNLLIERGTELRMSTDGIHLRLVGLKEPLLLSRSYPLTLVFEKGGTVNADLSIDLVA